MLLRRGTNYYCRVWVPKDLRGIIGRHELKKSLRTSDRKEAKAAASQLVQLAETAFLRLRMGILTDRELEQITAKLVADFTGRIDEHRQKRGDWIEFLMDGAPLGVDVHNHMELLARTFQFPRSIEDVEENVSYYTTIIAALERELATGLYSWNTRSLARTVAPKTVEIPPPEWFDEDEDTWLKAPPVAFARVCDAVLTGLIEAYRVERERLRGRRDPLIEATVAARIEQAKPRKRLSELYQSYKQERTALKIWSPRTLDKYDGFHRLLEDILGDCELIALEEDGAAARLIENLQRYPRGKNQITSTYRGKPFDPRWADKPGFNGIQAAQLNDILIQLGAWFDYALGNPKNWGVTYNPFKNKRLQVPAQATKPKKAYTRLELEKLVVGLMKQRPLVRPERFWIPLIALFTGARINEICQLRPYDIEVIDGIWCFRFTHEPDLTQRTKAKRSRYCPVHPVLTDLGLVDYVLKVQKERYQRLFPLLTEFKGQWSKKFGTWYNERFEPRYITAERDKSFHSTRHTLISWFKANMKMTLHNLSVLKSMVGHLDRIDKALIGIDLDKDMTWAHYGESHSPKVQLALLKKLDYGLDFSVLKARLK